MIGHTKNLIRVLPDLLFHLTTLTILPVPTHLWGVVFVAYLILIFVRLFGLTNNFVHRSTIFRRTKASSHLHGGYQENQTIIPKDEPLRP